MGKQFVTCPSCGSNLDHGERCDCQATSKYHKQGVELLLEKESDLYQRICKVSARTGEPVKEIVNLIATVGISNFMESNLGFLYKNELD